MWLKLLSPLLLIIFFFEHSSFAADTVKKETKNIEQDVEDLKQRMSELEEKNKALEEWYSNFYVQGKGRMSPFLGESISFGGYLETAVQHIYGPDTDAQTSAYSNVLGLDVVAEFSEKIKLHTQAVVYNSMATPNPQNNPNINPPKRKFTTFSFSGLLSYGYVEIDTAEKSSVQIGMGAVPFGRALQNREPTLFLTRAGPQMANQNDTTIISNIWWSGIHLKGAFYNLYTFTPIVSPDVMGIGGRLFWSPSDSIVAGISAQSGVIREVSFYSHGLDFEFKKENWGFLTEYAYVENSGPVLNTESYYFEPYYKFYDNHWVFFVRADYLSFPTRKTGTVSDPTIKWQNTVGVNYLPLPNVRLRLSYSDHDYVADTDTISGQKRDYESFEFSAATAF
ncbi:hypothetical protein CIK05_01400 [Bdellovibrio sp. qaytius]|nr:hypothetical protein CIK05_01400 [Bdellovibrio sp. qaytius]